MLRCPGGRTVQQLAEPPITGTASHPNMIRPSWVNVTLPVGELPVTFAVSFTLVPYSIVLAEAATVVVVGVFPVATVSLPWTPPFESPSR